MEGKEEHAVTQRKFLIFTGCCFVVGMTMLVVGCNFAETVRFKDLGIIMANIGAMLPIGLPAMFEPGRPVEAES